MTEEIKRLRRNLMRRIQRYNKKLLDLGLDHDSLFKVTVPLTSKRNINRVSARLTKEQKNPYIDMGNFVVRKSDIEQRNKEIEQANKNIIERFNKDRQTEREIARKWGREYMPVTQEQERPRLYSKDRKYQNQRDWQKFGERLRQSASNQRGAFGDDLKERVVKAIRGDVYIQPNGYKFLGQSKNLLAKFIMENMTGNEVEFFFGGNLNFEFIYSMEDEGYDKEYRLIMDILNSDKYPKLKEKWQQFMNDNNLVDIMNEEDLYLLGDEIDAGEATLLINL